MSNQPFTQEAALFRHLALAEVRKAAPEVYNAACSAAFARANVTDSVPDYVQTLEAQRDALLAVAEAYGAWEADLIINDGSWDDHSCPRLTQEQVDELVRIQTLRNDAIDLTRREAQP